MANRATSIHGPGGRNKSDRLVPRFIVPVRDIRAGLYACNDNQEPLARRMRRMSRFALVVVALCGVAWLVLR